MNIKGTVFYSNKNLGFNKDQVVRIDLFLKAKKLRGRYQNIKQEFLQHPNIQKATIPLLRARLHESAYRTIETTLCVRCEAGEATLNVHEGEISVLPSIERRDKSRIALLVLQG